MPENTIKELQIIQETYEQSQSTIQPKIDIMGANYDKVIEESENQETNIDDEDVAWAYVLKGNELSDRAVEFDQEESDVLFGDAYQNYYNAVKIKTDMHEAYNNWGIALSIQAKKKEGEETDRLYKEACKKFADAVKIKPDKHKAYNNWGLALSNQADKKEGEEADRLYKEACEKYAEAVRIKPDVHEAFFNWGLTLFKQAEKKDGEEADRLYKEACKKYAEAVRIKPDRHEVFNNWVCTLIGLSKNETDELKKREYLNESKEKIIIAENLEPGSGSYNLACVSSLEGNETECQKWLENSLKYNKLLPLDHLMKDTDLDAMRDKPWFQEFLQKVKSFRA